MKPAATRRLKLIPLLLTALLGAAPAFAAEPEAPPLALAQVWRDNGDVSRYWASEKLDGVRAWWDGKRLLSRTGHAIHAPGWFTAALPAMPLDGELWIGRGRFEEVSGAVRRREPAEDEWRRIRYMVFDLPAEPGHFDGRLAKLKEVVRQADKPWLQAVEHFRPADYASLLRRYNEVLNQGGEGLMLHRADALHQPGRSDALLKMKPFDDGEARVVGHAPGQGKYAGLTGALLLQTPDGRRFAAGSGLTDALRRNPPPVGSLVTYRYSGLTAKGLPRHPRFHRVFEPL